MKSVRFLLIIVISQAAYWIVVPFRSVDYGGFRVSSVVGFVVFFFLTIICLKKFSASLPIWQILTAIIVGHWIFELPGRILYFQASLISLPDSLFHTFGIFLGFLFWRSILPFRIAVIILGCLASIFMYQQGWDYWLHKLNFGTFTGKIEASALPTKFEAFDEQTNLVNDNNFQNRIVLLDFWHTRCGVCFEKFPQLQAAFERYKNDSSVLIYAVDRPIEEDKPNQAFEMIKEEGYSFPVVIAKDEEMPEKFGVKFYPTTFVINRNGMIVYKGDIAGAVRMVAELKEKD
jgi:thiol-disulfide isomerase/thioredoxin